MYTLEDLSSVANFITAYEESSKFKNPVILFVMNSLFPKTKNGLFVKACRAIYIRAAV